MGSIVLSLFTNIASLFTKFSIMGNICCDHYEGQPDFPPYKERGQNLRRSDLIRRQTERTSAQKRAAGAAERRMTAKTGLTRSKSVENFTRGKKKMMKDLQGIEERQAEIDEIKQKLLPRN